jgi:lantibiotic modifying enzyme
MIVEIIDSINQYLKENAEVEENAAIGLHSGLSGLLLYNQYHQYYRDGKEFLTEDELNTLLSKILSHSTSAVTFSGGLTGKLWVFDNLHKNGLLEMDPGELQTYADLIHEQLIDHSTNQNWDNLHGAFGILFFLIHTGLIDEDKLMDFLNIIKIHMFKDGVFIFHASQASSDDPQKSFNLSLSHGISGHIIILTKAASLFPNNPLLRSILSEMIAFLLKFKNADTNPSSYFPHFMIDGKPPRYTQTRVAWCYGDIGPGFCLYRYASAFNDPVLKEEALQILLHAAEKRGMDDCQLYDVPLCHGTAGVMHIFNRLYMETQNPVFKNSSDYWLEETISQYKAKGIAGFASKRHQSKVNFELSSYLLCGVSGIALALLSKWYHESLPAWDGLLLLS